MNKKALFFRMFLSLAIVPLIGLSSPLFAESTLKDHKTSDERLDSLRNTLPYLEEKVMSTLMSGCSQPVQFSGELRLKGQYHRFTTYPDFLGPHEFEGTNGIVEVPGDDSYLKAGWEESVLRFGLVARPGRNTILWSRFGFTHTFPGNRVTNINGNISPSQQKHDSHGWPTNIFEDMCAGIAIRTVPVSFWLKMGNILWTEASPFTIWKAQPRVFGWEYLPYEIEQPISRYYEYNIAKGEKIGRAAWHKKAFDGINLESINLPLDFYVNLVYGKFQEYDKFEREYMDFATDLAYAAEESDSLSDIIETGYGDSYRHVFHTRFAKKIKNITLGINYNNIHISDDIIFAENPYGIFFNKMFNLYYMDVQQSVLFGPRWSSKSEYRKFQKDSTGTPYVVETLIKNSNPWLGLDVPWPGIDKDTSKQVFYDSIPYDCGKGFYKEPNVFSFDVRGKIGSKFELHADVGLSKVDTIWVYGDLVKTDDDIPLTVKKREKTSSGFMPALYSNLKFDSRVILEADLAYISPGFYSPFSLACPMDAFYAFGTNLLGAGTFVGPTETSPYFQNMAGGWLSVQPKLSGYGHLKVKYGQHFQLKKARDLLFFPYRLCGMDINSIIMSTYTKWGVGTIDFPFPDVKYDRRLGDESYDPNMNFVSGGHIDESPDKGGIRADYLSVYEGFVPYDDPVQVLRNYYSQSIPVNSGSNAHGGSHMAGSIYRYRETTILNGKYIADNGDTVVVTDSTLYKDKNGFVPMHKKYSFNFEIDGAYDIGPLFNYKNDFFVGGYLGISGVSKHPKPLSFNVEDEDVLLWSLYLRFEPAIALSKKFYIIGLFGYENWRSDKAWMNVNLDIEYNPDGTVSEIYENYTYPILKRVPIDYRDIAWGLGFDWDMLDRVGLHVRYKWMKHKDVNHLANNMKWYLLSGEITTFF